MRHLYMLNDALYVLNRVGSRKIGGGGGQKLLKNGTPPCSFLA
jgi:hypothetical protein